MIDKRFRDINCNKSKNKYKSSFVRKRCQKGPGRGSQEHGWDPSDWNRPGRGNQNKLRESQWESSFGAVNRQRNARAEAKQICRNPSLWDDDIYN